jgi:class 3 adenylate cyclase/tetratricopeptide (TPR) repeat protein
MQCLNCQAENPVSAKFCMECGSPLAARCAGCGATLPERARFCTECGLAVGQAAPHARAGNGSTGPQAVAPDPRAYTPRYIAEKILKHRNVLEGERKQVTVLFADIKESMNLAESVGAEVFHGILDRFFSILSAGVHRFEGTVNQFTGDGIMALFGAPIAHEDHAHRACYAALHLVAELERYADELRRSHGLNFSVRMGINSGEVVVGKIGDDLRMDYTAQGHTVGLASRVEQLAAANSAYLTEHTKNLINGYFDLRDLGEFALKGVREPLRIYQLAGVGKARTRLDVSRSRGFSRFVGRDAEIARLEAALANVASGQSQVVGVVAEAGAGKSRLCYEFVERCRAQGMEVLEAHCVPHGSMIPFLPVLELLRNFFGVAEQDGPQVAREKIAGRLLLLDENLRDTLPHIFDFLGVAEEGRSGPPLEPHERLRLLASGLKRILAVGKHDRPSIILIEDLHWIDGASDAFVAGLIALLDMTTELVLVNTRPGYRAPWMDASFYSQIDLAPLGPDAIAALLRDLLGADVSVRGLAERIAAETAGNPFFVEEVVRTLIEAGTLRGTRGTYRLANPYASIMIPSSVHDVLAARLDRLDQRHKAVLATAAVIGKQFGERLLRAAVDEEEAVVTEALSTLRDGDFIEQTRAYPEIEYAFHHPITQEVAYASQLGDRRAAVHRRVAEAVESQCCGCGRSDENAALLAHHWEGAGDLVQAVVWRRSAAEWAAKRDLREARRHWEKLRELVARCTECPQSLEQGIAAREALIEIGWKLGASLDQAQALHDEGTAMAERAQDPSAQARLLAAYAMAELFAGEVERGLVDLQEAIRVAETAEDRDLNALLHGRLAYMNLLAGHLDRSFAHIDAAVRMAREGGDEPLRGYGNREGYATWLEGIRTLPQTYQGDLAGAVDALSRIEPRLRAADDAPNLTTLIGFMVTLAWFRGDGPTAMRYAQEQVGIATRLGTPTLVASAYDSLGVAYLMNGQPREAVGAAERALAIARETGTILQSEAVFVANLAAAYLGTGEEERAIEHASEAVAIARRRKTMLFECRALLVLARALLDGESPRLDEAAETLASALTIVVKTGAHGYEPFLRVELARLARLQGDAAGGERELADAARLFRAFGANGHAERLDAPSAAASA